MGLPIHLNHRPVVWRTNPLNIPVRCWRDRQKTLGVDLTRFGTDWVANVRPEAYTATPVAQFTVDDSGAATGELVLALSPSDVSTLTGIDYVFDVVASGVTADPLTVFVGSFSVDGN